MNRFSLQTILLLVALLWLLGVGCSATGNKKLTALSEIGDGGKAQTRVELVDGIYPVVLDSKDMTKPNPKIQVVELNNVPVEGDGDSATEKIRVIARPLLRFQTVSNFDFKFEKNECTEVGFQNTEELKAYTRDHVGSRLAVVIDNKVISHHKIREAITVDEVRITCCTVGGGDHLHKHLKELKLKAEANRHPK